MLNKELSLRIRCQLKYVAAILLSAVLIACSEDTQLPANSALSSVSALSSDSTGGFARAHRARKFIFPEDHLAHPDYKHEWWYFTGNLRSSRGERFGYQLTIFRIGLVPDGQNVSDTGYLSTQNKTEQNKSSKWRSNHFFMGHLAVTDVNNKKFYYYEKFARKALNFGGAERVISALPSKKGSSAIKVWLEDWQIQSVGNSTFPMRLTAKKGDVAIELNVTRNKPVVFHGYEGLSQKGQKAGNASYYYSITRLPTQGEITIGDVTYQVLGNSWFDREWSTSALEKDQAGWDWFSLQLNDGRDIMFYKLRRDDGSMDQFSSGTVVDMDGNYKILAAEDIRIEELNHWQSPHSGVTYPASWNIRIPKEGLEMNIEPLLMDQEHNSTVRYWEGAVRVSGAQQSAAKSVNVEGFGYVELAGYGEH